MCELAQSDRRKVERNIGAKYIVTTFPHPRDGEIDRFWLQFGEALAHVRGHIHFCFSISTCLNMTFTFKLLSKWHCATTVTFNEETKNGACVAFHVIGWNENCVFFENNSRKQRRLNESKNISWYSSSNQETNHFFLKSNNSIEFFLQPLQYTAKKTTTKTQNIFIR